MLNQYFDILIGAVTFDVYKPWHGGRMFYVDCTHGYHRKTIHMATRYPRTIDFKNNILNLLPVKIWYAIGASWLSLAIAISVVILVYSRISSTLLRDNLFVSQVLIRLFAGATEPDNEKWFTKFSTGIILMLIKFYHFWIFIHSDCLNML